MEQLPFICGECGEESFAQLVMCKAPLRFVHFKNRSIGTSLQPAIQIPFERSEHSAIQSSPCHRRQPEQALRPLRSPCQPPLHNGLHATREYMPRQRPTPHRIESTRLLRQSYPLITSSLLDRSWTTGAM